MWKRLMSVLLVVLLCCPIFAVRAEEITADGRVNRALLVGCDRFLTQTDTTPSSRNNVLRMADALSGGTLNMQTLVTREDGLSSASALVALIRETFADADADDVSYFYISTHGLWNTAVNGLMTLLLSDGESEEGITAYELRRVYDTRFPLPVQTRSPNGQMWVDRYYIAWQLGSGPVRYGYLTRRHIFEELTAYRAAARLRGTPVLLPADIGAAFSSALRQMRLQEKNIWISPRLNKSERLDVR